jgi:hypothetical protein
VTVGGIPIEGGSVVLDHTVEDEVAIGDPLGSRLMAGIRVDSSETSAVLDMNVFDTIVVAIGEEDSLPHIGVVLSVAVDRQIPDRNVMVSLRRLLFIVMLVPQNAPIQRKAYDPPPLEERLHPRLGESFGLFRLPGA